MRKKEHGWATVGLVVAVVIGTCMLGSAQDTVAPKNDARYDAVITILCHMSGQLRLVRPLATYAILSPIRSDQKLYTQYVVNILEGSQGKDYVLLPVRAELVEMMDAWGISAGDPGLIEGMRMLANALKNIPPDSILGVSHDRIAYAVKNISFLLGTALDEARASIGARNIDSASDHMRLAYACAFTALGAIEGGMSPGSVSALLMLLKGARICRQQPPNAPTE